MLKCTSVGSRPIAWTIWKTQVQSPQYFLPQFIEPFLHGVILEIS
jgi:hypothetical protein